jgi:hypothetical protein
VLNKRKAIMGKYKLHGDQNGYEPIISSRGCLCAGTIVVELGETVRILQPDVTFHHRMIIESHFNSHKCVI